MSAIVSAERYMDDQRQCIETQRDDAPESWYATAGDWAAVYNALGAISVMLAAQSETSIHTNLDYCWSSCS
jgi:hypothetical protein